MSNAAHINALRQRIRVAASPAIDYTQISTDQAISVERCERSAITQFPGWAVALARRATALRAARHTHLATDVAVFEVMHELITSGDGSRDFQRLEDFVASVDVPTRRALCHEAITWLDGWRSMVPDDVELVDGDRFTYRASKNLHLQARVDGISADGTQAFIAAPSIPAGERGELLAGNVALLAHLTNHPIDAVKLVYPAAGITVTVPVTTDMLGAAADRYVHAINTVTDADPTVTAGPWCRFCDRRADCPTNTEGNGS